jgi:hypothetical protein
MNRNLRLTIRESAMIQKAKHGAALRDFLAVFYGDQLEKVLAQEPETAPDLDKPVTEIWICEDKKETGHALHAGYTIWRDFDHGHLVTNDDDLSEFEDPKQAWQRIYPVAKTESRRKLEQYLDDLKASGKERTKLSEQLRYLVADVLDAIAEAVPVGTTVEAAGMTLTVREVRSNLDSHLYMTVETGGGKPLYYVFEGTKEPEAEWYLHRDLGCGLCNARPDQWLAAANCLPEIASAFQAESDRVIAALRQGFEVLRKMAEE